MPEVPLVSSGSEIQVPRSQNLIFLREKCSVIIILARETDGGAPGALTGTGEVENLKKHNFRAISWIWLDFAGSGVISMDIEEF